MDGGAVPVRPPDDVAIALDGDTGRIDSEKSQKVLEHETRRRAARFSVYDNVDRFCFRGGHRLREARV